MGKSSPVCRRSQRTSKVVSRVHAGHKAVACKAIKAEALAAPSITTVLTATPALAESQEVMQLAQDTNVLGLIATALFVLIPVSFLITLYTSSSSSGAESGGYQPGAKEYYDKSKKDGNKKTNITAKFTGKGAGMYIDAERD